ncbi:Rv1733c family protein [Streptomyces roseoviridis]|uniref:Integral membrane protein n=1 Tax=Streptomyces roseoviridis TaxID=67361 RepID=A0ABV5QUC8_9ACTN
MSEETTGRGATVSGRGSAVRVPLVLVSVAALVCGAVAAVVLWAAGADAARDLAAHRHQVQATTTGRAEDPPVASRQGGRPPSVAPAVWEYPDDVHRSGTVDVPRRTPQGRTVTIWVDDRGTPVRPPDATADLVLTALAGGTAAAGAVAASGAGLLALVRRSSEGRRLAALEREWEQVEPLWSGRLRRGTGPGGDDA